MIFIACVVIFNIIWAAGSRQWLLAWAWLCCLLAVCAWWRTSVILRRAQRLLKQSAPCRKLSHPSDTLGT